ncbi:MAG: hypothetical protein COT84_02080 [Chlamydiae bacterium CG10_big_fil_rev_8_21_14_0_10_35_9]|nr:MAG: hypothetical protein COT84_02080 [Chlamydiae bacterium CG10_big_fil_rev_8_21_14_0_10_35_9]
MTTAVHDRLIPNFDTQPINANSTTLEERVNALANEIKQVMEMHKETFFAYNKAAFKANCFSVIKVASFAMLGLGLVTDSLAILVASVATTTITVIVEGFFLDDSPIHTGLYKISAELYEKSFHIIPVLFDQRKVRLQANYIQQTDYVIKCIAREDKTCLKGFFWKYFTFNNEGEPLQLVHPLEVVIPTMNEREFNRTMEVQ